MAQTSDEARRHSLRERIDAKRQLEKKSLRSIEALLEKNITEVELLDHCVNLWQQTYQDCTEERALGELCGYPLCDNAVAPQTKKLPTYKISLRNKKVYSNEKQRVFCCVRCYERSEWLKSQLSEVPLWMLEAPFCKKISLHRSRGDPTEDSKLDGNILPQSQRVSAMEVERLSQDVEHCLQAGTTAGTVQESKVRIPVASTLRALVTPPHDSTNSEIFTVDRFEKLLSDWFTIESLHHVVGQDRFLELRAKYDNGLTGPDRAVDEMMAKYFQLCSFLDQQEKLDGITYSDEDEEQTEKVPQAQAVERQVKKKRVSIKSDKSRTRREQSSGGPEFIGSPEVPEPVLPPIDRHQQSLLREKILLERLAPLVETTSCLTRTPAHILAKDVSQLIQTFNLTRDVGLVRDDEIVVVFAAIIMLLDRKAGGEAQISQDVRPVLDSAVTGVGLTWGDIGVALRKVTDPQRLFNSRAQPRKPAEGT